MQQPKCTKRRRLTTAEQQRLTTLIEARGEVALATELGITRQTLGRAAAGLALYTATFAVLSSYLRSP
jgi:hypothetical protein